LKVESMQKSQDKQTLKELLILKKAVEASGEAVFLTDREGIITYVNPQFTKLYGYQAEEVVGKSTPRILKSRRMTDQDYERFWDTLVSGQVVTGEFINKCKDGKLITIQGSANPITNQNGDVIGFLAIQRDITARKMAQEELQSAHAIQQSILDGVGEPIMVIGSDYEVVIANRSAREFATGEDQASLPIYCYQISHHREKPCDGLDHPCPIQAVHDSGQPVTVVHQHYQSDGEKRFVEVVAAPFWKADGTMSGIIESMRDITEYKRTEAAMLQYAERLKALAAQLAEVEDAERQRLARELHDRVGQNLTALGINLNIIQMQLPEDVSTSVRYHLEDSLALIERTAERIRDVMADLRPPVLDDYGLVSALRWYGAKISRRIGIPITVEGDEPDPRMNARIENALFRITQEALTNITKHAQATSAHISVHMQGDLLRLSITDDGIGFDSQNLTESDGDQGWGLLSITERAEAVGGQVRIDSSPDQGTTITVEVPR
jgi:two-component system sensor histidine kinase UhpB